MGTIKAGFWILVVCFVFILFFQNYTELQHPVVLKLNLYFQSWTSAPINLWVLLILFFLLGFFVSSLSSTYERIVLKRELKALRAAPPAAPEEKK